MTKKNEPAQESMGASMVTGYNNWDRIFAYKKQWETVNPENSAEEYWKEEFRRIILQKELYQYCFIIEAG